MTIGQLRSGDRVIFRRAGVQSEAEVCCRWGKPAKVLLRVGDQTFTVPEAELLATLPPEVVEVDVDRGHALAAMVMEGRDPHAPVMVQLRVLASTVLALVGERKAAP